MKYRADGKMYQATELASKVERHCVKRIYGSLKANLRIFRVPRIF